ncbi:hypothetical protein Back11_57510 [Paenibacillus baekrokdamisoli]|uniref:Uncharacterized protein n=1 Tax=Paenibacillus baekrokdamisoli TaxID=1712516 RepID=A0A3G9J0X5_9BACL|nr:hypothetical protein [Paenibacillus baekrokdamisoli]MBB3072847.1 hypothetical protein [Paenibacillus baekrokdamisoli]BBH24406.1 hypothetical protein Back11_57510 [Paenibacillus baekrokdamisoli]
MKRIIIPLALALVLLSLGACTNHDQASNSSHPATAANLTTTINVPSAQTDTKQEEDTGLPTGAVHTDSIALYGQVYEINYWNEGEFDYTRFVIKKNKRVLFDSLKAGVTMEGGMKAAEEENIWSQGVEQNNRPAFLFTLADNRPNSASIIVEELDGSMQVTMHDNIEAWFEDVDGSGSMELVGFPSYGEVPLSPALVAIYQWKDNQYKPSPALTHHYWEARLKQRERAFQDDPSEMTLDSLLSAYLLLNKLGDAKKQFPTFSKWAAQSKVDDGFVAEYEQFLSDETTTHERDYVNWMSQVEPLQK